MNRSARRWSRSEAWFVIGSAASVLFIFTTVSLKRQRLDAVVAGGRQSHNAVTALAVSPDGRTVASAGPGRPIHLWDVHSKVLLKSLPGSSSVTEPHSRSPLDFSPDGRLLASAGDDGNVSVWSVAAGARTHLLNHDLRLHDVLFSPSGKALAAQYIYGDVRMWDVTAKTSRWRGPNASARLIGFSADSKILICLSGSVRCRIAELRVRNGRVVRSREIGQLDQVVLSPDRKTLACVSESNGEMLLTLRDFSTGKVRWARQRGKRPEHFSRQTIAFSPSSRLLATVGSDGVVLVWRAEDGLLLETRTGHDCVAFSSDEKILLTGGGSNGGINFWPLNHRDL